MSQVDVQFRILVVEDDVAMGEMMQLVLEHEGFVVQALVRTGREAIDALDEGCFDVAIIDLALPDMDGIDVLRELRARAPRTRLIVCSAHELDSPQVVRAREHADGVISKLEFSQVGTIVRAPVASSSGRVP